MSFDIAEMRNRLQNSESETVTIKKGHNWKKEFLCRLDLSPRLLLIFVVFLSVVVLVVAHILGGRRAGECINCCRGGLFIQVGTVDALLYDSKCKYKINIYKLLSEDFYAVLGWKEGRK